MTREVTRVEPLSTCLENRNAPIERRSELALERSKLRLEAVESSLAQLLKSTVYCTSVETFAAVTAVDRWRTAMCHHGVQDEGRAEILPVIHGASRRRALAGGAHGQPLHWSFHGHARVH